MKYVCKTSVVLCVLGLLIITIHFKYNYIYDGRLGQSMLTQRSNIDNDNEVRACRYVFLDLGSNKGVQIRKLFEPNLYPNASIIPVFDRVFGNISERQRYACAFGFEANPRHMKRLKFIEESYKNKDFRVDFYHLAVSDRDNDTVTIFSETNFDLDWGAGIIDQAINNKANMTKYKVHTVDIVRFIVEIINPLKSKAVFMKMDIEGSEYLVLPHMIKNNILCKDIITSAGIELHEWARKPLKTSLDLSKFKQNLKLQSCVPTSVFPLDDESYNLDVAINPDS
ncbi:uncharacterized protein LOC128242502 [Mya arenaria]|uniref:uncharacterized protein LOC128242502 n=1 Tax=Mya arenaria TaxID=6604 RepID=UPI0022E40EB6|nr:uncharacterized protein LOC128242502 [Mya arenaria]XP_052815632.1 uncharacterized protein LOC128242502 [Mya arenaria]